MKFTVEGNDALIHRLLKLIDCGSVKYRSANDWDSVATFEINDERLLEFLTERENIKDLEEIPF